MPRNKYNAKKVEFDGFRFDSMKEYLRYRELRILEQCGDIHDLQVHPRFELFPKTIVAGEKLRAIFYTADFQYRQVENIVVEDVKGFETRDFKLRANLFRRQYAGMIFKVVK